jgi:hypothetical protein
MPLGNVLGEVVAKVTSVRISDLGGGQRRLEIDSTGEVKGQVPGQGFATMIVEGITGQTVTYTTTATVLAASGAVVRMSGRGVGIRTGEGHKAVPVPWFRRVSLLTIRSWLPLTVSWD